jgi:hypothetical protein
MGKKYSELCALCVSVVQRISDVSPWRRPVNTFHRRDAEFTENIS